MDSRNEANFNKKQSQYIDRFRVQKRLHAEINVGAGSSIDFAKIQKHQIKTRPPQPESPVNRSNSRIAKIR
jgi:hypothetical protein